MKRFLLIAAVTVTLAIPASAQVYLDPGTESGGNRLDDPNYGWPNSHYRRGYDASAQGYCRVIRERVVTTDGRVIYISREICG